MSVLSVSVSRAAEHNLKTPAEQTALHEEKKRFAAEWIATHGTPDQQARLGR